MDWVQVVALGLGVVILAVIIMRRRRKHDENP
ncbi:MAG: LPXTG cell wall anchor domain-containing protein [Acidobacteria bacterium]|nr:LPXTG cell wall anchor domain-containing protein [Acidobacteriota bacterium]MBI3657970.1 LPXTG cell wall anchor domain-containing protein [Acidobacteriota bacterium]